MLNSLQTRRVRPSSIALALALIFALGGLYAIDRSLSVSSRNQVRVEAIESAALVESFLTVHAEVLHSIRSTVVSPTQHLEEQEFHSLVRSMAQYAPAFEIIWVTDSASVVRYQHVFNLQHSSIIPVGVRLDTLLLLHLRDLVAQTRLTNRTQLAQVSTAGVSPNSDQEVVFLEPLVLDNQLLGFAGATMPVSALLNTVEMRLPHIRGHLIILAGRDTIGALPNTGRALVTDRATAPVRIPGGGSWLTVVSQPSPYDSSRILIWSVGLATLAALVVALLHERRQGLRLAERSVELEHLSTELLRANRTKSEFLASVSHELRTPLNAIVGFVELLKEGVYGGLSVRQSGPVDRIASSANHLRQLVDQLLDLAKMAAGRLEIHPEIVDLKPFVLEAVSEVEPLIYERGLSLSINIVVALPRVRTDPMHLRQILLNLLGNAAKFTATGGIAVRIKVVEATDGPHIRVPEQELGVGRGGLAGWVAVQIADTGIGIAPSDQERIFNEFEQVGTTMRAPSAQRGTGLGLPISRRLARLLGGDITLESEPGKGSAFSLWLPIDADVESLPRTGEHLAAANVATVSVSVGAATNVSRR